MSAEDTDEEHAARLALYHYRQKRQGVASVTTDQMQKRRAAALASMKQRVIDRAERYTVLDVVDTPESQHALRKAMPVTVEDVHAHMDIAHMQLLRAQAAGPVTAFVRSLRAPTSFRDAVQQWEEAFGVTFSAVYYYSGGSAALVFEWLTREGAAADALTLTAIYHTEAPGPQAGGPSGGGVILGRADMEEVGVRWANGVPPEDGSDRGAVLLWNRPLAYVACALTDAYFAGDLSGM